MTVHKMLTPEQARALTDDAKRDYDALESKNRLVVLEDVIERGLSTFVQVGQALMEIRDARHYRVTHGTFDVYCRERWGFSDRRARQLVEAAEIGTMVPVANERQARELAPLLDEPEQLREAWAEASTNGEPTAAQVREVVARHRPTLSIPINEEALVRQQRETLISQLDQTVFSLESSESTARAECQRLLAGGDAGPFTPSRFEKAAAYALAFADELRKAGIRG